MDNTETKQPSDTGQNDYNIKDTIFRYIIHWRWILLSLTIALTSAFLYLRYSKNIYKTSSQIRVLDPSGNIELPSSAASFIYKRSGINLENEIYLLTSYNLLNRVVKQTNFNVKFYEIGRLKLNEIKELPFFFTLKDKSELTSNTYEIKVLDDALEVLVNDIDTYTFEKHDTSLKMHSLPFELKLQPPSSIDLIGRAFKIITESIYKTSKQLKSLISISTVGQFSHLLELSINGENFERNEQFLNALMENHRLQGIMDRQQVSENTIKFIDERFQYVASELDSVETKSKTFRINQNIPNINDLTETNTSEVADAEKEIIFIQNQIDYAKTLKSRLSKDFENSHKNQLPSNLINNIDVNQFILKYNNIIAELNLIINNGGGVNNPRVLSITSELDILKTNVIKSIEIYLKDLQVTLSKQIALKDQYLSKSYEYLDKGQELRKIKRQKDIKEALYILLLQKREEAMINKAVTTPAMKIVEYAFTRGVISPKKNIIYTVAIILGILIPIGIIFLIYLLDTKIHTKEEISKDAPNIPVVGEIPVIRDQNNLLFLNPNSTNILAESFRILCSNIDYVVPNTTNKAKVILSTSTVKGEGKTFMSINLSLAFASLNKKVLLIGADLRNPQIHKNIGVDKNTKGLSNYLYDFKEDWRNLIFTAFENYPNHNLILSGSIPPNPTQLLTNGRFKQLIEDARQEYDYIIVDSAPTILVTDTMLISQYVDVALFVVRANFTEKKLIEFSKNLHETNKIKNLIYVVNGVGSKKSYGYGYKYGYGYGYGYGYNYGYGYGYANEDDS